MQQPTELTELGNTDYLEEHQGASNYETENASHSCCIKARYKSLYIAVALSS